MSLKKILIRIAKAVLEQVISQITQQLNIVQDQVQARLQSYVQQVLGGVWTGKGADAFVGTISDEAMPRISNVLEAVTGMNTGIVNARQVMEEADSRVRSMVDSLRDVFSSI